MKKILVVDDKQLMRDSVATTLTRAGWRVVVAECGASALEMIARHRIAAVVTDLKMPNLDGLGLLQEAHRIDPDLPIVLMTAYATVDTAVSALKIGAFDYIQKPFDGDVLVATVERAVRQHELIHENRVLKETQTTEITATRSLVGQGAVMQALRVQMQQMAQSHGTVLIHGESGTGKEVVAHHLHAMSARADEPMLCLNCAALSESLLESELFGHEKGAFTGADQVRKGRFELADRGTLLLDEISEVGLAVQAKLLRVLQEGEFERVGSSTTMSVDVRVMATTNRDLEEEVRQGRFRQDLYFRLNVLPIYVPPLAQRGGDIPLLAEHFLRQQAKRDGGVVKSFSSEAMTLLKAYHWPGNVREMQNVCERAAVLSPEDRIDAEVIRAWLVGEPTSAVCDQRVEAGWTLEEMERDTIVRTLRKNKGHRKRTAASLGIGVRTLGLKLKRWKEMDLVAQTL